MRWACSAMPVLDGAELPKNSAEETLPLRPLRPRRPPREIGQMELKDTNRLCEDIVKEMLSSKMPALATHVGASKGVRARAFATKGGRAVGGPVGSEDVRAQHAELYAIEMATSTICKIHEAMDSRCQRVDAVYDCGNVYATATAATPRMRWLSSQHIGGPSRCWCL